LKLAWVESFSSILFLQHRRPPPSGPPKSLYEIERDMMQLESTPPQPVQKNSRAMTVEELERELTGEQMPPPVHILHRPSSPSNMPLPIGTPPQQQHFPPNRVNAHAAPCLISYFELTAAHAWVFSSCTSSWMEWTTTSTSSWISQYALWPRWQSWLT
jgi:hypothetical protein